MILVKNKWFPFGNYKAINIGFNELSWSLKDFDGVKLQRIHKK